MSTTAEGEWALVPVGGLGREVSAHLCVWVVIARATGRRHGRGEYGVSRGGGALFIRARAPRCNGANKVPRDER